MFHISHAHRNEERAGGYAVQVVRSGGDAVAECDCTIQLEASRRTSGHREIEARQPLPLQYSSIIYLSNETCQMKPSIMKSRRNKQGNALAYPRATS